MNLLLLYILGISSLLSLILIKLFKIKIKSIVEEFTDIDITETMNPAHLGLLLVSYVFFSPFISFVLLAYSIFLIIGKISLLILEIFK